MSALHRPHPQRSAGLAALLSLGSALLLWGCPSKPNFPECKVDPDCADHQMVCINGFCKQCRDDAQCKAGEQCKDNGCQPKPECTADKECAAGQLCKQQKCVAECSEATAAQDCGQGRRCVKGRCAADEECVADADCGSEKSCVQGLCKPNAVLASSQKTLETPDACGLTPVLFGYDESTLAPKAREQLDQAWECLKRVGFKKLTVAGHCDERGTTEYNLALGSRRAEAVRRYLGGLGAEAARLRTVSFGKEKPADPGHDEAAFAKNRRVELVPEK